MIDSLSSEELQFIKAVERYKSENSKHFLSWTEVLKIFKELGYKKTSRKSHGPTFSLKQQEGSHDAKVPHHS